MVGIEESFSGACIFVKTSWGSVSATLAEEWSVSHKKEAVDEQREEVRQTDKGQPCPQLLRFPAFRPRLAS